MKFCPKCGSILVPATENGRKVLKCMKCGYVEPLDANEKSAYTVKEKIKKKPKDFIQVIDVDVSTLPVVDFKCEACGNDKAYVFEVQTRSADEPATRIYICTKCGKRYREYQ